MLDFKTNAQIEKECVTVLENQMLEDLIFYFENYRENREEFAKTFKEKFSNLVDNVLKEFEERN